MISNIILPLVTCLYMATFAELGLTLNTPSNNQQSAQQVGTFNVNQAGSNLLPYMQRSGGISNVQGSALNTNTANSLNAWGNQQAIQQAYQNAPQPSRYQQLTAPGYDRNPAENTELQRLIDEMNAAQQSDARLIDEAYGASAGYLDQAESALRGDYPNIQNEINSQYNLGVRQADTGKASTLGTIQNQQITAEQRNQSVLSDARRLYDELQRGYAQRFGGASSAGQAAFELANVERQRQQGKIQQEFGNTMRQIETARTQVEQKYQDQLAQLEQSKNSALNEAQRDFQNKLLQIQSNRAANEQAKAQAKLSVLQDLRNKVFQINQQNLQFQQTLQAQKLQATNSLADYANSLGQQETSATSATTNFTPSVSSNLQTSSNTQSGGFLGDIAKYVGSILPGRRDEQTSW